MAQEAEKRSPDWAIMVDGETIPLRITTPAIIAIEQATGRTLFEHALASKERSVPLVHLAIIVRALAGPTCPVPALRSPEPYAGRLPILFAPDSAAEEAIVRNGMINILARVMLPIVAAMRGGVTEVGEPKPNYTEED